MPHLQVIFPMLAVVYLAFVAEASLQPAIKNNEQVPSCHLIDLELRHTLFAVIPVVGQDGVGIATADSFERQLHSQIEAVGQQRL